MNIPEAKMLKILKRKVFKYDSSEADQRAFRQHIVDFFSSLHYEPFIDDPYSWYHQGEDGQQESFKQHMVNIVHARNDNGETFKYMYFNERTQRLYLDNAMWEWCIIMAREVIIELKKIKDATQKAIEGGDTIPG